MSDINPHEGKTPISMDRAVAEVNVFPDAVKNALLASWLVAKEEFIIGGLDVEVERFIDRAKTLGITRIRELSDEELKK